MKIKYHGHSNFLIKSECNILIDPFFTGNPLVDEKEKDNVNPDIIIVSHAHADHIGDTEYIAKKTDALVVSNFEICNYFIQRGVRTHALHIGGKKTFSWGFIKLTPAFHGSSFSDGSYGGAPAGIIVNIENKSIFHAGDTGLSYELKMIGETNDIFVAMLPVGDNFTMGLEDATKAAEWLRTKIVIPMHYNTFDPIKVNDDEFDYAFRHFRLEILKPCQEISL